MPALAVAAAAQTFTFGTTDANRYLNTIKALITPAMEGRGAGTKGLTRAAHLLEQRYQNLGLEPAGTQGYLQPFGVITRAKLAGDNHLHQRVGDVKNELRLNEILSRSAFHPRAK